MPSELVRQGGLGGGAIVFQDFWPEKMQDVYLPPRISDIPTALEDTTFGQKGNCRQCTECCTNTWLSLEASKPQIAFNGLYADRILTDSWSLISMWFVFNYIPTYLPIHTNRESRPDRIKNSYCESSTYSTQPTKHHSKIEKDIWYSHWEELHQSVSNFIFRLIISKN